MSAFVNDFTTALAGTITSGATSLTVEDEAPPGLTAPFTIRIDDEFLEVTATASTTWTVTRASEESSRFPAASHTLGATVELVLTAGSLNDTEGRLAVAETHWRYVPTGQTSIVSVTGVVANVAATSVVVPSVPADAVAVNVMARMRSTTANTGNNATLYHGDGTTDLIVYPGPVASYLSSQATTLVLDASDQIRYAITRAAGTIDLFLTLLGYWTTE